MKLTPWRTGLWLVAAAVPASAPAALSFDEAQRIALAQAPGLAAQASALAGAEVARSAAGTLPDPKLIAGLENFPISGPERFRIAAEGMTMQRIGLMQDVPNRAKRQAREAMAASRAERERAMLAVAELAVRRDTGLAWLATHFAERRAEQLAELERENRLLQDTLDARIAAGRAMAAEHTMARQDALMIADRRDDAARDVARARAALRRWVGERAAEPLAEVPPPLALRPEAVRAGLHRHAEVAPYHAMQAMARAEADEMAAEERGDWSWEIGYSRRGSQFGDMVSFQLRFDLPWQKAARQQPLIAARLKEAERIESEREELLRRHAEEIDAWLAELQALDVQRERLHARGLPLAAERVALAMAAYEAGRGDLGAVLAARREAVEARLRLIDLDAQRAALRLRLTTLIVEN